MVYAIVAENLYSIRNDCINHYSTYDDAAIDYDEMVDSDEFENQGLVIMEMTADSEGRCPQCGLKVSDRL